MNSGNVNNRGARGRGRGGFRPKKFKIFYVFLKMFENIF